MRRLFLVLVLILFVPFFATGCAELMSEALTASLASPSRIGELDMGMSESQVKRIMGSPEWTGYVAGMRDITVWRYTVDGEKVEVRFLSGYLIAVVKPKQ